MRKILLLAWVMVLLTVQAAACGRDSAPVPDPEKGWYTVYYQGNSYTTVTQTVQLEATEPEEIARELIDRMKNPDSDVEGGSVLPERVELTDLELDSGVLRLYFNSAYLNMDGTQGVICRAALTRTLTQIPGIEYISIYAGNQPLMDANGVPIGNLSASDFVNVIGRDINTIQHATLTLYFANPGGDRLVGEEMEVTYSNTASVEEFIVEHLIQGPEDTEAMRPVLPSETQLLGISVRDGICYVNFSEEILTGSVEALPEISLYAIVDSLTSLPSITQVQITIAGSSDQDYRGISLSEPFFRNLDYISDESGT